MVGRLIHVGRDTLPRNTSRLPITNKLHPLFFLPSRRVIFFIWNVGHRHANKAAVVEKDSETSWKQRSSILVSLFAVASSCHTSRPIQEPSWAPLSLGSPLPSCGCCSLHNSALQLKITARRGLRPTVHVSIASSCPNHPRQEVPDTIFPTSP